VAFPAYDDTTIALRSLDEARKEQKRKNFNAAALRLSAKTRLDFTTRKIPSRNTTSETEKTG